MPFYQDALDTLQRMKASAEDLDRKIRELEANISSHIAPNTPVHIVEQLVGTPTWVKLANARVVRDKHREWERKIHGVMMGYEREMQGAHKNFNKDRAVGFSSADVTVGTDEKFAKAIQYKHTVSRENADVNEMIAKAANQLTGESGETPLPTQRKVIDMMINEQENWWPFDLSDFSDLDLSVNLNDGVIPFERLKTRGAAQILTQLKKYKHGRTGLNQTTVNSLVNHVPTFGQQPQQPFAATDPLKPRSSALFFPNGQMAPVLTVKITYGKPRKFRTGPDAFVDVKKIVFCAYRINGELAVAYLQHS
jgi:hypothetical protein